MLAEAGDADRADAKTLRTVLALRSFRAPLRGHVVAEVRDVDNEPLLKLVGGDEVEACVSHDVLGRLMLMSAREPGLASVYSEVLGFDGDEFYSEASKRERENENERKRRAANSRLRGEKKKGKRNGANEREREGEKSSTPRQAREREPRRDSKRKRAATRQQEKESRDETASPKIA